MNAVRYSQDYTSRELFQLQSDYTAQNTQRHQKENLEPDLRFHQRKLHRQERPMNLCTLRG